MEQLYATNSFPFKSYYVCFPNPDLNEGNRIVLPESALSSLIERNVTFPYFFRINKYHNSDHDSDANYIISSPNTNSDHHRRNRLTFVDYESDYADDDDSSYEEDDDNESGEEEEDDNNKSGEKAAAADDDNERGEEDEDDDDNESGEEEDDELNKSSSSSHCGVNDFTSEEGIAMLPEWMMLNLGIEKGDEVVLRSVNLEKGKYVKLNPLNENFLKLHNPKVILEKTLRQFACLTPGDIIPIVYNDVKYDIEVVETNPSIGISVIDTDCEVEFSLNEPELKPEFRPVIADCRKKKMEEDVNIFTPFSGKARRLDDGGVKDVESEGDGFGKRYMANVVISLPAAVVVKQSEVKEPKEKKKFVAFSGKKYTLS